MNQQLEQWECFTTLIQAEISQVDVHSEALRGNSSQVFPLRHLA